MDVQNFLSEGGAQQTLAATQTQEIQTTFSQEFQDIPHTNMRKVGPLPHSRKITKERKKKSLTTLVIFAI